MDNEEKKLTAYVHDILQMEQNRFKLSLISEQCEESSKSLKQQSITRLNTAKKKLEKEIQELEQNESLLIYHQKLEPTGKLSFSVVCGLIFWVGMMGSAVILGVLGGIISVCYPSFGENIYNEALMSIFFVCCCGGLSFLGIQLAKRSKKKDEKNHYRRLAKEDEKNIKDNLKSIPLKKQALADEEKRYQETQNIISFYKNQAQICKSKSEEISNNLIRCYALNIIPPDYRTIDCVTILDHAFRNNLADTIREAVLYYEELLFRGEVVRGINNIYSRLGELLNTLNDVRDGLYEIQREVSDIKEDIHTFAITSSKSLTIQKQILDETQATKMAIQAAKESYERSIYWA